MQTTLLDIQITEESKGNKTWEMYTIKHKDSQGKNGEKKLLSFNMDDELKNFLDEVELPKMVEITTVKNDRGFWDWTGIKPITEFTEKAKSWAGAGGGGKKGDWETAEERARKQILIVRQSSLSSAIEAAKIGLGDVVTMDAKAGKIVDIDGLLDVAEKFAQFVFKGDVAAAPTENAKPAGPKKVVRRGAQAKMPEDIESDLE